MIQTHAKKILKRKSKWNGNISGKLKYSHSNQWFRFQEKYDMENAVEHIVDASCEEPNTSDKTETIEMHEDLVIITSTMDSNETDDDGLLTDGEPDNKGATRRGYSNCDECAIPFITKKQLKVSSAVIKIPIKNN